MAVEEGAGEAVMCECVLVWQMELWRKTFFSYSHCSSFGNWALESPYIPTPCFY